MPPPRLPDVYDADGVVASYKYQRDGNTFARISYDYDAFGRLTTRTAKDDALTLSKHYTFTEREVNGKLYAGTQIKAYSTARLLIKIWRCSQNFSTRACLVPLDKTGKCVYNKNS